MKKILWALLGLGVVSGAQAEIYKHIDANGHVTYSNQPKQGSIKLTIDPLPPSARETDGNTTSSPANTFRLELEAQKQRNAMRRKTLEEALVKERQALEEDKAFYEEAKNNPEAFTLKAPETFTHVVGEDGMSVLGGKQGPLIIEGGEVRIGENGPVHHLMKVDGALVYSTKDGVQVPVPYEKPMPGYVEGPLIVDSKPVLGLDGQPIHQLMKDDGTLVYSMKDGAQVPVPYEKPMPGYKMGPPIIEYGKPAVGPDGQPLRQLMRADGTLIHMRDTQVPVPYERPIPGYQEGPPIMAEGKPVVDAYGKPIHQLMKADGSLVYTGKPLPFKKRGGRNMAWYAEKLNQLELEIKTHEDNIQVLERELSRLW